MKRIFYVLSLFTLFSCSSSLHYSNLVFYDSHGDSYSISTAALTIKDKFNLPEAPKIIILATSDENSIAFKKQLSVFSKINAEEMQYLYVVANSKKEDRSGYYVSMFLSKEILSGSDFKIIIYNDEGIAVKESTSFFTENELITHLTKSSSGR